MASSQPRRSGSRKLVGRSGRQRSFLLHCREIEPARRSELVEAALASFKERQPAVVELIKELRDGTLDEEADA
jgi:hypothetical protein